MRNPRFLAVGFCLVLAAGLLSMVVLRPKRTPPPLAAAAVTPPWFDDVTATSGIGFTYRNGEETADHYAILESLGGGAALLDFDGDGLLDVYLPGGGDYAGSDFKDLVGRPGKLYRNLGGNKFEDVTAAAGLATLAGGKPWFYSHGVAVADVDRDGWPDLLVTGYRAVALFRNNRGKFEDVTAKVGLDTGIAWATSAAFADLDGDGFPELYACQYVDWSWTNHPRCGLAGVARDVCPPKSFMGLQHKLYHNVHGTFVDVSMLAGVKVGGDASKGLGVVIVDVDGDGKPDVYVANDTTDNLLYVNRSTPGSLRFVEVGLSAGVARDDRGTPQGSMGADAGDPARTGKPFLWVTNYENEMNALYENDCAPGRHIFNFHSQTAGIAAVGQVNVGWGTGFLDVDLDGWEDLFASNGHAIRHPTARGVTRKQFPLLLQNLNGRFRPATARLGGYAATPWNGRGVAIGDLDNDGKADLVLNHLNEPTRILRGTGGDGHGWLGVQLVGKDNACVVGAKAVLDVDGQKLTRFAKGGGSYASSGDRRLVFGLGPAEPGRLTVTWPDGTVQHLDGLAPGRYHRVQQGAKNP